MPREQDLAARIERLRQIAEAAAERASARVRLARDLSHAQPPEDTFADEQDGIPVERLYAGRTVEARGTACFARDSVLSLGHRHGRWPLAATLEARGPELLWLSHPSPFAAENLRDALFLDVETTGLAGGTGAFAFMVGMAWFEDDRLVLSQLLMRTPAEEPALLSELTDLTAAKRVIVSFNGKAFDVPLLETRYTLQRQQARFPQDHLDLLAASRRVWRLRLSSCRLANLEQSVLGVRRWDDVPGSLVPQLYMDYLRTGDARCIAPVFDHNALDVLSLVTLAGRLAQLHRDPLQALADDPLDLLSLGKAFDGRRSSGRPTPPSAPESPDAELPFSRWCYQQVLQAGLSGAGRDEARSRLARLAKRSGDRAAARSEWECLAAEASDPAIRMEAFLELAKLAEHHDRDLPAAIGFAESALALAGSKAQTDTITHRLERLRSRIARRSSPSVVRRQQC